MARSEGLSETKTPTAAAVPPGLPSAVERQLAASRLALAWERIWPALSPAGFVAGIFLILAGFDVWRFLPVWLHWLILIAFIAALGAAVWHGFRGLRLPDRAAGLRRLERSNNMDHRPLSLLGDKLAGDGRDPIAAALWEAQRRRIAARLASLQVTWPEAGWWRRDRYGLHAALALLVVVAWASPGEKAAQRLEDALVPGTALPPAATLAVDGWITPPLYTGRPPLFLARDGKAVPPGEPLLVPAGSLLKLRLQATRLDIGQAGYSLRFGGRTEPLAAIDDKNAELDLALDLAQGETPVLALLRRDQLLAEWPLRIVPDLAPTIAFADAPKPVPRQAQLEIALNAEDDYGVQKIEAELSHPSSPERWLMDWPAPPPAPGAFSDKRQIDFTAHPLAGIEVTMRLKATDALQQEGFSEPIQVKLPARKFTHPVAKAVVEQRRELALKPAGWQRVAASLRALALAPESFRQDTTVHLALRMAAARLTLNRSAESLASAQALLWETALRIEDGKSSLTERDFQALYDRLQDALDKNADDPEVQRLMQELREAMDRLMEEMMKEALERMARGEEPEELGEDEDAQSLDDLQDMMDQAEQMAREGDRQSAQDMLQQLQRMLENLKNMRIVRIPEGRQRGQQRGQRGQQFGGQQMQELNEMLRQQQQLLDRSFRRSQQQGRGENGQRGENESDARAQEELRRKLGEMMGRLGERGGQIPDALGRADRSMRDAREALRRGEPGDAMQGQTDAMDQLRQGLRDLNQSQRGDPQGQADSADGRQNQRNRNDRDPFGRNVQGYEDNARGDAVPGLAPVERARRILEELQRRAGNRDRPTLEREYLDRLLRRF